MCIGMSCNSNQKKSKNLDEPSSSLSNEATVQEPHVIERVVEKEVPVEKTVYIDNATDEKMTSYWYCAWETPGGRVGYGLWQCDGPYFDPVMVNKYISTEMSKKYPQETFNFIMFTAITEVTESTYNSAPTDWKE